jgi:preprotein translocase subunit YajC
VDYLIILVALFAVMWFLLIRPQRKRQVTQLQMQDSLQADDEIITAGGLHGRVKAIEDEIVHVEIAPGTVVRIDRRAVAAVAQETEPEAEAKDESESESPVAPRES